MSRRAKATLCISLRNNDALRVSLQRADGSSQADHNVTWADVQRMLQEVTPMSERRRQYAAKLVATGEKTAEAPIQPASKEARCQCSACRDGVYHGSCCAVHNEPAYPAGPCNCGAVLKAERRYAAYLSRCACNLVAGWKTRFLSWLWISFHPGQEASNLRAILKRYPRRSGNT